MFSQKEKCPKCSNDMKIRHSYYDRFGNYINVYHCTNSNCTNDLDIEKIDYSKNK